jgi:hypothetical protein
MIKTATKRERERQTMNMNTNVNEMKRELRNQQMKSSDNQRIHISQVFVLFVRTTGIQQTFSRKEKRS